MKQPETSAVLFKMICNLIKQFGLQCAIEGLDRVQPSRKRTLVTPSNPPQEQVTKPKRSYTKRSKLTDTERVPG